MNILHKKRITPIIKKTKHFFKKKERQKQTSLATKEAKNDSSLNLQSPRSEVLGPPS
jgi:hypothetical protein